MPDQPSPIDDLKAFRAKLVEKRRGKIRDDIQHDGEAIAAGRQLKELQDLIEAVDSAIVTINRTHSSRNRISVPSSR